MMRIRLGPRLQLAAGVALVACHGAAQHGADGGTHDAATPATPVPIGDFVSAYGSAVCNNIAGCCSAAGYGYDSNRCKQQVEADPQANLSLPHLVYDPQSAGTCIQALTQAAKSCVDQDQIAAGACDSVFTGTASAGESCTDSIQCKVPAGGDAECTHGVCRAIPAGKAGDPCEATCTRKPQPGCSFNSAWHGNARCYTDDGLACSSNGCGPLAALGQTCSTAGCVAGAYCNPLGRCVVRGASGAGCENDSQCADGLYCDNRACVGQKSDGTSCSSSRECANKACLCSMGSSCNAGTCGSPRVVSAHVCGASSVDAGVGD